MKQDPYPPEGSKKRETEVSSLFAFLRDNALLLLLNACEAACAAAGKRESFPAPSGIQSSGRSGWRSSPFGRFFFRIILSGAVSEVKRRKQQVFPLLRADSYTFARLLKASTMAAGSKTAASAAQEAPSPVGIFGTSGLSSGSAPIPPLRASASASVSA